MTVFAEKRAAAQKAEADFFSLLKESGIAKSGAVWKDVGLCRSIEMSPSLTTLTQVKKGIVNDPRYDAVGSSSLREELFNTFIKARETAAFQTATSTPEDDDSKANAEMSEADRERQRKERKERAVKERENKVRSERSKVDADIVKSRQGLNRGEDELEFRCAE